MNTKEFTIFFIKTLLAGMAIGVGAVASLLANAVMADMGGKIIGAILFGFGIYMVIIYEMKLFTGMVAFIPQMKAKDLWQLAVCFIGNAIGIGLVALCIRYTFIGDTVAMQSAKIIDGKIYDQFWAIKCFCSAILCGVLITFSVTSASDANKKGLSGTLAIILPVVVFAFCGFDHSLANMIYLYLWGAENFILIPWQTIGYVAVAILGNIVGGVILTYCQKLMERLKK